MKRFKLLLVCLLLASCEINNTTQEQVRIARDVTDSVSVMRQEEQKVVWKGPDERFKVERVQLVKDDIAYGNYRGVYVITDSKTGQEFVGVSGIGITELGSHTSGKVTHEDER